MKDGTPQDHAHAGRTCPRVAELGILTMEDLSRRPGDRYRSPTERLIAFVATVCSGSNGVASNLVRSGRRLSCSIQWRPRLE